MFINRVKKFIGVLTLFFISILSLGVLVVNAQSWTAPTANPPGNNVPAPVNVGPVPQEKSGVLGLRDGYLYIRNVMGEGGEIRLVDNVSSPTQKYWAIDNGPSSIFRIWRWTGSSVVPFVISPQGIVALPVLGAQAVTAPDATDGIVGVRANGTLFKTSAGSTGSGAQYWTLHPTNPASPNFIQDSISRVGGLSVGTSAAPSANVKLHVDGSAFVARRLEASSVRATSAVFGYVNTDSLGTRSVRIGSNVAPGHVLTAIDSTGNAAWRPAGGSGGGSDNRWIGENNSASPITRQGNVGIGYATATGSLFAKLQVQGDTWVTGNSVFGNAVQIANNLNVGKLGTAISNSRLTVQGGNIHVHHDGVSGVPHVYTKYTNSGTGTLITDGVLVGLDGGNNMTIWNFENTGMYLGTSNLPRMYIHNNGNVGIGTGFGIPTSYQSGKGNPTANLHVAGTVRLEGIPVMPTGTSPEIVRIDAQGNLSKSPASTVGGPGNGTEVSQTLRWTGTAWSPTGILKVGDQSNPASRVVLNRSFIPDASATDKVLSIAESGIVNKTTFSAGDITNIINIINGNGVWTVNGNNIRNKNSGNVGIGIDAAKEAGTGFTNTRLNVGGHVAISNDLIFTNRGVVGNTIKRSNNNGYLALSGGTGINQGGDVLLRGNDLNPDPGSITLRTDSKERIKVQKNGSILINANPTIGENSIINPSTSLFIGDRTHAYTANEGNGKHEVFIGSRNYSEPGSLLRVSRSDGETFKQIVTDLAHNRAGVISLVYDSSFPSDYSDIQAYSGYFIGGRGFRAGSLGSYNFSAGSSPDTELLPLGYGAHETSWDSGTSQSYGYFGITSQEAFKVAFRAEYFNKNSKDQAIIGSLGMSTAAVDGSLTRKIGNTNAFAGMFKTDVESDQSPVGWGGVCVVSNTRGTNEGWDWCIANHQGPSGLMVRGNIVYGGSLVNLSSKKYKENIEDLAVDVNKVLSLNPVSYILKDSGERSIGLIAEDVHELGLTDIVGYNEKGEPNSLDYTKLPIYLIEVVKSQQKEIDNLKKEVEEIKNLMQ